MSGKTLIFCLVIAFLGINASANIALPVQEPPLAGDIFTPEPALTALQLVHEKLVLNLSGIENGFSHARYVIRNRGAREIASDLFFITPYMDRVTVQVNGSAVETAQERIASEQLPWKPAFPERLPEDGLPAFRFRVVFAAQAETVIDVTFRLPAGYDNQGRDQGYYAGEAAHALNWSVGSDSTAWYAYNLESATTFQGGIQKLDVEIIAPQDDTLVVNIPLVENKPSEGVKRYTGSFEGIPAPYIEARVKHEAQYSMIGFQVGGGLVTNYIDYTEFMAQALFDFYFYNHQISVGVEGNPFGTGFKIPVLYTFIFADKVSSYFAFWGDLRVTAGALFDLSPVSAVGFRISAGLRLTLTIFEVAYDFYPFDAVRGYVGRMTFLYKISL